MLNCLFGAVIPHDGLTGECVIWSPILFQLFWLCSGWPSPGCLCFLCPVMSSPCASCCFLATPTGRCCCWPFRSLSWRWLASYYWSQPAIVGRTEGGGERVNGWRQGEGGPLRKGKQSQEREQTQRGSSRPSQGSSAACWPGLSVASGAGGTTCPYSWTWRPASWGPAPSPCASLTWPPSPSQRAATLRSRFLPSYSSSPCPWVRACSEGDGPADGPSLGRRGIQSRRKRHAWISQTGSPAVHRPHLPPPTPSPSPPARPWNWTMDKVQTRYAMEE